MVDHNALVEEAARLAEAAQELQDAAAALISRTGSEEQSLRQRTLALESDLRRIQASLDSLAKKKCGPGGGGCIDPKIAEKVDEELCRARCLIVDGDIASLLPSKAHGLFLKSFLGPLNVRATRKDVQLKVKEEYNSYRAWLLYLYTTLALRENILRVNGSDIRPWWIYHHYCAMLMAIISLTWEIKRQPDCAYKQRGVQLFLVWAMMQGVSMLLQNRYQRQRLYTRIALGKAKRMDVVWGETAGVEGQLLLLCPILFILQGFEAFVGLLLLRTAIVGVIVCGILLVLMAIDRSGAILVYRTMPHHKGFVWFCSIKSLVLARS
ncbi:hypothetical protein ZIOFF_056763 [Zingiber officinale]|uniref:TMPIT-like protein n=1 Tax=Zingiber officinale TaxID=94328 RepID=A0A8J5FJC2_ZINOF|nr:hypothetical protein ZIOFF_056763 [Zingiber officinale]